MKRERERDKKKVWIRERERNLGLNIYKQDVFGCERVWKIERLKIMTEKKNKR